MSLPASIASIVSFWNCLKDVSWNLSARVAMSSASTNDFSTEGDNSMSYSSSERVTESSIAGAEGRLSTA